VGQPDHFCFSVLQSGLSPTTRSLSETFFLTLYLVGDILYPGLLEAAYFFHFHFHFFVVFGITIPSLVGLQDLVIARLTVYFHFMHEY